MPGKICATRSQWDTIMTVPGRVNPRQAYEMLMRDPQAVLIDVRTRIEFDYVGHPPGALHIPWKEYPDWNVNPDFIASVRAQLAVRDAGNVEDIPVLLLCRSGNRSQSAAEELSKHGFTRVYNIEEGFEGDKDTQNHRGTLNGWRFRGLPWEQT
jgi:rhodanese-related sulfurtransferase